MNNTPNLFVIGAPKAGTTGFVAGLKVTLKFLYQIERSPVFLMRIYFMIIKKIDLLNH